MPPFPRAVPDPVRRVMLPRLPDAPVAHPFPILATVAPVFAGVALWLLTSSAFALIFAALGPVIAIASIGDGKLSSRRTRRREAIRFETECKAIAELINREHTAEREEARRLAPGAAHLLAVSGHNPDQWRSHLGRPLPLLLGRGSVPSALVIDGRAESGSGGDSLAHLDTLRAAAAVVSDAPVIVDARLGVGIFGPRPLAVAAARALVVQLAAALPPSAVSVAVDSGGTEWEWTERLPHGAPEDRAALPPKGAARAARSTIAFVDVAAVESSMCIVVADSWEELPRELAVVMQVGGRGAALVRHPDAALLGVLQPEFIAREEALVWAALQSTLATTTDVPTRRASIPVRVDLAAVLAEVPEKDHQSRDLHHRAGLSCVLGMGEEGQVALDLVSDGPHAVVGGTTGSGKSELLVSWVLAMAAGRSPREVSFLFVDLRHAVPG